MIDLTIFAGFYQATAESLTTMTHILKPKRH